MQIRTWEEEKPMPKNNLSYKNSHNTFPALEDMPNRKRNRICQTLFPFNNAKPNPDKQQRLEKATF